MAEYAEKPRWMAEPSLQDIPQEKLDFLQKMVFESRELSQKDLLPFLMALAQRSRSSNITFSTEEMNTIIEAIKKYKIRKFVVEEPTLNEIFIAKVGEANEK